MTACRRPACLGEPGGSHVGVVVVAVAGGVGDLRPPPHGAGAAAAGVAPATAARTPTPAREGAAVRLWSAHALVLLGFDGRVRARSPAVMPWNARR